MSFAKVDNLYKDQYRSDFKFVDSGRIAAALEAQELREAPKLAETAKAPDAKIETAKLSQELPGTGGCSCCGKGGCGAAKDTEVAQGPDLFKARDEGCADGSCG